MTPSQTLAELERRAITAACASLRDPGPPIDPGIYTDKGYALFIEEIPGEEAANAALSMLKEIDDTISPNLYCLFFQHLLEMPDRDPLTGIVLTSGGKDLPPQQNKFFIYQEEGETLVFEDPPKVFELGPAPNLFDHFAEADEPTEWIWRDYED